jgi:hypothetical protein
MSGSRPGERRGGRRRGTPNKTTRALKEAILEAAELAGGESGLVGYLTTLAKTNTSAFATLLGKVLPLQVSGEDGGSIKMEDTTPAPTPERFKAALALLLARGSQCE